MQEYKLERGMELYGWEVTRLEFCRILGMWRIAR